MASVRRRVCCAEDRVRVQLRPSVLDRDVAGEREDFDLLVEVHHGARERADRGEVARAERLFRKGGPLAGGALVCDTVQCPWHGSQFDVRTGEVKAGPAKERIATYAVTEAGGRLRVSLRA